MKKLMLFANEFPYGTWEPYLEEETEYYIGFKQIIICSLQFRDEHASSIRKLNVPCDIVPVRYVRRVQYFWESFTVLRDINLYKEIFMLVKNKQLTFGTLTDLFVFLSRAHHEARVIDKALEDLDKENIVLYSYRFEYQPYVAILLKKNWKLKGKIICRAHGYDLYEKRHKNNYIPMRKVILEAVDAVYPCSMNGVSYLQNKYPEYAEKVVVKYLGTKDYGLGPEPERKGKYRIVSCSGVTEVKRIDRIIDALALIKDIDIEWTHYGDGPLFDELKADAAAKLNGNITCVLNGNVEHGKSMEEYCRIPYDLFVNVSSSEGIPVSIRRLYRLEYLVLLQMLVVQEKL